MKKLFFVIGASGAGKTTAVKHIEADKNLKGFVFCYFDSIGVPPEKEMIEKYGSGEGWQKASTERWIKKAKEEYLEKSNVILDAQTRPSFIEEACKKNGITNYEVILLDCTDDERTSRLIKRNHRELANEQMMNWAKYLRTESKKLGYRIIDNTDLTEAESKNQLIALLGNR